MTERQKLDKKWKGWEPQNTYRVWSTGDRHGFKFYYPEQLCTKGKKKRAWRQLLDIGYMTINKVNGGDVRFHYRMAYEDAAKYIDDLCPGWSKREGAAKEKRLSEMRGEQEIMEKQTYCALERQRLVRKLKAG